MWTKSQKLPAKFLEQEKEFSTNRYKINRMCVCLMYYLGMRLLSLSDSYSNFSQGQKTSIIFPENCVSRKTHSIKNA